MFLLITHARAYLATGIAMALLCSGCGTAGSDTSASQPSSSPPNSIGRKQMDADLRTIKVCLRNSGFAQALADNHRDSGEIVRQGNPYGAEFMAFGTTTGFYTVFAGPTRWQARNAVETSASAGFGSMRGGEVQGWVGLEGAYDDRHQPSQFVAQRGNVAKCVFSVAHALGPRRLVPEWHRSD